MNEALQIIAKRYSCRGFDGILPEREALEAIALAGVQSPSAHNNQPWEIFVITDKTLIEDIDAEGMRLMRESNKTLYDRMITRGGKMFYGAPCVFLIAMSPGSELDTGIVTENIALAASSLGLGNVICGLAKIPLEGPKSAEYREKIGIPDGLVFGMTVLVGNKADEKAPHEPDLTKIHFV